MKINSAVLLTLFLLTLMIGSGVMSGMWGFALGREALKGVTQPDARPKAKAAVQNSTQSGSRKLVFLKEEDIIKGVNARKQGKPEPKAENKEASVPRAKLLSTETPAPETAAKPGFPIISQDQGVTLEIRSAREQGGSLLLEVSLKNDGSQIVQFLYSFLDVADNRGRSITATTEGLPAELPPNSPAVSGTVSIPTALLEGVEQVSLTLTDYPDQQLRLQASAIPVR